MAEGLPFDQLVKQVRAGEEAAAAELVRLYEPAVRRVIRLRLTQANMRRRFDSQDVCQSVLASFFVRAALGQYDLQTPEHLVKLLTTMARHKLIDQVRKHQRSLEQEAGEGGDNPEVAEAVAADPTPSRFVAGRDLLDQVRARLTTDERLLADRRAVGREWADIAAELGGTADGLRKKLTRAVERVAAEIGLDV